jgi:hypothetical protein
MLACDLMMEVRSSRSVTAEQVRRLEHALPIGSPVIAEQLDFLFQVDHYAERADRGWTRLLARAVLSGIVLGETPMGALTEEKADWLVERIGRHRISSARNLELIARVMARSESSPAWLQELLVELSGEVASTRDRSARGLQTMLAENFDGASPAALSSATPDVAAEPMPLAAAA